MKKFIRQLIIFSCWLSFIPTLMFFLDPFDYYDSPVKLKFDRIHSIRKINVADWALAEVSKIPAIDKEKADVVAIGDSRGRYMISGGYDKGWKGRTFEYDGENVYDLSFGGAQMDESISIFKSEESKLLSMNTLIIILPIDRLFTEMYDRNRIETSAFNSPFSHFKYLFNVHQIKYFDTKKSSTAALEEKNPVMWIKVDSTIQSRYILNDSLIFNKNLALLEQNIAIWEKKYSLIILIPPYQPDLYEKIRLNHSGTYAFYLQRIMELGPSVVELQPFAKDFRFVDPIHGLPEKGHIFDLFQEIL